MSIEAGNIPYSEIGPKVKFSDIEKRIYRRVLSQLHEHDLFPKLETYDWYPVFVLAGKPKVGEGKVNLFEIEDLDASKDYSIKVVIPLKPYDQYLVHVDIVIQGSLKHIGNDWIMEPISWEHNLISRQVSPSCEELLFHSRDFSKGHLPGHSSKYPWHHQWHVTTKKKLADEKEHTFIWKPYYYQSPKNGIHNGKRWVYKTPQYQSINEFRLRSFFDLCDICCSSGIKQDRSYYIVL